jgi:hypothetical protein
MYQRADWEGIGLASLIAVGYMFAAVLGIFLFPPFFICLWLSYGDLEYCSFGLWSNNYEYGSYYDEYGPTLYKGEAPEYKWEYEC